MTARLVGVTGPAKGSTFLLDDRDVTIGRDPSNAIVLPDLTVSPRHCVIRRSGDHLTIAGIDPGSAIFVNGLPATRVPRRLVPGDEISVGRSLLQLSEAGPAATGRVVVDDERRVWVLRELRCEDTLRLTAGDRPDATGVPARATAGVSTVVDLAPLLKIGTAISGIHGLVALRAPLMDLLLEVVPADRVALVIAGDAPAEIDSMSGCDRVHRGAAAAPIRVQRALLERALREGVAALARSDRPSQAATAAGADLLRGQMLVAPMVAFDRVIGALYMEADDESGSLSDVHLQLVVLVASMAAVAFDNARNIERYERENRSLQAEIEVEHEMVGDSAAMRALYARIARVSPTDATVLIRGESGTGKELIARAVHRNSPRAARRFVAINCAALAETLLESEMFGHERGAFTGAVAQKKGRLELAEGGTVFLDEIGELPLALQAKLLRALQEREFERVGGTRAVRVDFRLVAATNRDLDAAMRNGAFRQDLYYRLNVVSLEVPPLRARKEDIVPLADHFTRKYGAAIRHRVLRLSRGALDRLCAHDWPGNVRELENAIERAVVLGASDTLDADDFRETTAAGQPESAPLTADRLPSYHDALLALKKRLVLDALEEAGGSFTAAARLLALHPNYLHRLMRNLDLRPARRRVPPRE